MDWRFAFTVVTAVRWYEDAEQYWSVGRRAEWGRFDDRDLSVELCMYSSGVEGGERLAQRSVARTLDELKNGQGCTR